MVDVVHSKYGVEERFLPAKSPERWRYLFGPKIAYYLDKQIEYKPLWTVPLETRRWIRNASDERCAQMLNKATGKPMFKFSERLGQSVVDWKSKHCYLYEGDMAGRPMIIEDWQYEYTMQTFGWLWAHPTYEQWIRRFQEVSVWIAKKNAKSPTLASTGVYLFCGEGEPGQKCYTTARDGEQAKISHMHAVNMIEQSPTLSRECQIYKNTWDIIHKPSKSLYKILHAKNANSQEGLNGSILVDETHVVGNDIMEVIKRSGISRMQPLHVEMSTAGDISNDYGKSRFDQGHAVSEIRTEEDFNPHLLFIDYSVSQKLPAVTFSSERKVMELALKANPGIGRLFTRENILKDYRDSRKSPVEFAQFKRYRLGVWLSSGINWIDYDKWEACAHPDPPDIKSLKKYPCAIGVDLSSTRDTTSVCLMFGVPNPDSPGELMPYVVPFFWIAANSIQRYRKYYDFRKFGKYVNVVDEEAIDQAAIADFINDLWQDNYDIRGVGFDPYHSKIFVNRLVMSHGYSEKMMREIPSSIRYMSGPTKDVETLIMNGGLWHSDNPFLNWQMGHVQVLIDQTDHYMPCKPGKHRLKGGGTDDPRKVDGVIAMVNADAISTDNELGFRTNAQLVVI